MLLCIANTGGGLRYCVKIFRSERESSANEKKKPRGKRRGKKLTET